MKTLYQKVLTAAEKAPDVNPQNKGQVQTAFERIIELGKANMTVGKDKAVTEQGGLDDVVDEAQNGLTAPPPAARSRRI